MAKQSGLGDNIYIHGVDLSGDVGSLGNVRGGPATHEATGINKLAFERLFGLRDGAIEYSSYFNPAEGAAHPTLAALPTANQIITYCRGTTLGKPAACLTAKQLNYDPSRGADGALTFSIQAEAAENGLEWCEQLTAGLRTDTTAANGAGVDFGEATEFGLQAYLQVIAFDGTDATIKLQESSDGGGADTWADVTGGAFATVTSAPGAQRIATARDLPVEQHLRVITTGTFTELVFSVAVNKNPVEVKF